jgi:ATP-dependent phosphoenolpyruvate carboxykinase
VADPYSERRAPRGPLPSGPPPWLGVVAEREGFLLGDRAGDASGGSPRFGAVAVTDAEVLPPIARVGPEQAEMLLIVAGGSQPTPPSPAELAAAGAPLYALKHGTVGGPAGSPGSVEVEGELIAAVLDAAEAGEVEWERDPDFGWMVAAGVPGVSSPQAEALCPRLLYTAHDRVYEHAEHVVEVKRRWHEAISAAGEASAPVLAATGWPPKPTGRAWEGE